MNDGNTRATELCLLASSVLVILSVLTSFLCSWLVIDESVPKDGRLQRLSLCLNHLCHLINPICMKQELNQPHPR